MFPPVKFLMFSAAVKGFVTACAPLVGLDVAIGADELLGAQVTGHAHAADGVHDCTVVFSVRTQK